MARVLRKNIRIGVTPERYEAINKLAQRANVSMSWLGERAFEELLERYSKDAAQLPFTFGENRQAS